ncbi:MAG TPA: hypothetical protein VLB01_01185 [Thermodesulfobacteriota bacterium]|nr:hypothetical protein [Thermodesulfobacteriota bacterium]
MVYIIIVVILVILIAYFVVNYYSATKGMIKSNLDAFFKAKSEGMNSQKAIDFMIGTRYALFQKKLQEFVPLYRIPEQLAEGEKEELEMLRCTISLMHIYESGAIFKTPGSTGFPTVEFLDRFTYNIDKEYNKKVKAF